MNKKTFILNLFCWLGLINVSLAQIRVPKLISDGMVLQRNTPLKIWGWASKGEKIKLIFNQFTYQTTANEQGDWIINLPKMKAGGPYVMTISGSNALTINNILIGEVWVCSGQSNMELPMRRVSPIYEKEIAEAENSQIRQFIVPQKYDFNTPQKDLSGGTWVSASSQNVLNFSAVAYFFAKDLYAKYKVPIGLINASLGGSPAEAWMSEEALKSFPNHYQEALKFRDDNLIKQIENEDNTRIQAWYRLLNQKDEGYKNDWKNPNLNTSDWANMKLPGYWADQTPIGLKNGVVWFRKKINLPALTSGKPAKLILGRIVDADSAFVNGKFVGSVSYQYPPRRYEIPTNLLQEGENTLLVRLINNSGKGGFVLDKEYALIIDNQRIDLSGEWQYKLGAEMEPLGGQTFIRWKPLGLYNAMIHPLLNFAIKGVIWYQGESNAGHSVEYRTLFPAMIQDWRKNWKQGDFPFLFVQLANFMEAKNQPAESAWAMLREAQTKTLALPKTGMAVIIDVGEWNDIHPLNKKDVGTRLSLAAQKVAYKDKNSDLSPIYQSMKIDGNKIILSFKNVTKDLIVKDGGELKYFAIAGQDKKFVWAKAQIKGKQVIVWSDEIKNPVAVRYAWADNPEGANLYSSEGLPTCPFRTDEW
jgi:sialate O-acetylesterase